MKKLFIGLRASIKLIALIFLATIIITALFGFIFKPTYSVSLNGEVIGYTEDKSKLQKKINEYIESGDSENVAFVQVDTLPEYELCLLKKDIAVNDDEIFAKLKNSGTEYYNYYAITVDGVETTYLATYQEAAEAIENLKSRDSNNIEKLAIKEKYETELSEISIKDDAIAKLYEEKTKVKTKTTKTTTSKTKSTQLALTASENTGNDTASKSKAAGVGFIRPISGTISSRFGGRRSGTHTGLDIAAPKGTPIKAAATGTVTYSGWSGGYGYMIKISHGSGVETYYAHCSSLVSKVGEKVNQGDIIAKVGSTGNSTGSHLHLEVRVNGNPQNPQNYVY